MRKSYVILTLFLALASPALAQPISKEAFREMLNYLGALNYWSKAPSALLMTCGRAYPETAKSSRDAYLSWQRKNTDINSRVDSTLAQFSPTAARLMGKSIDEYQVSLTRIIDAEVIQSFTKTFDDADRRMLCADFKILLDSMLSEDLAKPRVNLSLDALRRYQKYTVQY